jgi:thiamine biosynthesis lipoprotein
MRRHDRHIDCFGGAVKIALLSKDARAARTALDEAERRLRRWHDRLTRFEAGSELSRLNADPRPRVPASPELLALAAAVPYAGELSGGLVDATLVGPIERAGYDRSRDPLPAAPPLAPSLSPQPAGPHPAARWRQVHADLETGAVERPIGVELDSGGLAKGLAADDAARALDGFPRFTVDCAGDLRVGGADPRSWRIDVANPTGGGAVATLAALNGIAVATSGVTRRRWRHRGGTSHHLLDPATGEPAFTGVLQATALAPTGLEAEVRAKTALLAGPYAGPRHLAHGGVLVLAGGEVVTVDPARRRAVAA